MHDPGNSLVICNVFGGPMPPVTAAWLAKTFPSGNIVEHAYPTLAVCARNRAIRDLALPAIAAGVSRVIFLDNDVHIEAEGAAAWLSLEADIASCGCNGPFAMWARVDCFHNHAWWIEAESLKRIPPPWFAEQLAADGCAVTGCNCLSFRAKALAAGLRIRHGGECRHEERRSWCG